MHHWCSYSKDSNFCASPKMKNTDRDAGL